MCIKEYNKEYQTKNKEKLAAYSKEYAKNNKDNMEANKRNWYVRHREELLVRSKNYRETHREQRNASEKKRKEIDITYMLRTNMSKAISTGLKRRNSKKSNSILAVLPYSINELKTHLEKQFESWMNWDNYGKYNPKIWDDNDPNTWTWQIDHIKPHSEFEYTLMTDQNFIDCWALSNLRPLSSKQNQRDGVRRARHK
jgi:hypothetical protein